MEGTAGFITRNVLAQNVPGGMQSTLYSGGYAVVSVGLGKRNRRKPREKYEILKSILPRGLADELLVDVRDDLRAPQLEQRVHATAELLRREDVGSDLWHGACSARCRRAATVISSVCAADGKVAAQPSAHALAWQPLTRATARQSGG